LKVIILAGGYGTRLGEYTNLIPKPMVKIGHKPIAWHIMEHYAEYGHKEFFLALGYKAEYVKEYFLNYRSLNSDFSIDLFSGQITTTKEPAVDWRVNLIDTGINTLTGGRIKRLKEYVGKETFMVTYGDGLSDIDLDKLVDFHRNHGKLVTISAVHPSARFGELNLEGDSVLTFQEKPQLHEGWINGGFMIIEPQFLEFIENDSTMLEKEPFERAASLGELMAYRHHGFWQCMDTKRDHELLESLWKSGAPWAAKHQ
jgi:glucose-1-phosphate cytidylyltransferase